MTLYQQIATLQHNVRLHKWPEFFSDLKAILADYRDIPEEILHALSMAEYDFPTYQNDLKMELETELQEEFEEKEKEIRAEMNEEFAEALEAMAEDYR